MRLNPQLRVIVISGGTASGKSALARALIHDLDDSWHLLQTDDFIGPAIRELAERGSWDPDGRRICRRMLNDSAASWMQRVKVSLLVEGFFKETSEIDALLAAVGIPVDGERVCILHLLTSEQEACRRRPYEKPCTAEVHPRARLLNTDGMTAEEVLDWAGDVLGG